MRDEPGSLTRRGARTASDARVARYIESARVDPSVLENAFLRNPNLSDETLRRIVHHPRCPDRPLIATCHHRPEWVQGSPALALRQLAAFDASTGPRRFVNDDEWLSQLDTYSRYGRCVRSRLGLLYGIHGHERLSELLARCGRDFLFNDAISRLKAWQRDEMVEGAPPALLARLAAHRSHHLRRKIAVLRTLDENLARRLADDSVETVRATLAANTTIPISVIRHLAEDDSPKVLRALLGNHRLRAGRREQVRRRERARVATIAARRKAARVRSS